jgi:hypothetical protein
MSGRVCRDCDQFAGGKVSHLAKAELEKTIEAAEADNVAWLAAPVY